MIQIASCELAITGYDLSATILLKLVHSCQNALNLAQRYIVNSKESARQIAPPKTNLNHLFGFNITGTKESYDSNRMV